MRNQAREWELGILLARAAEGAPLAERHAAFTEIVRRFQDMAYGYALSLMGDPERARDAAQEAFLVAWREIGSVRDPLAFPGWFRRVVHSQCVRLTRRGRVRTVPLEAAASLPALEDGPSLLAEQREFREQIHAAVRELPERERVVTALYYINQHSQGEIAAFLEVPLTTVRKRLYTARRRLRERLESVTPERTLPVVQQNLQESRPSRDEQFLRVVRLFNAVGMGDVETVRTLLAEDAGLARATGRGQWGDRTPLHVAAEKGQTAIAALLLDHGADIAARDQGDNATPLHWAMQDSHLETIRLLVERGAPVDVTDDMHERGPLGWAVALSEFQPVAAAYVIEQGAPVDLFSAIALRDANRIRALVSADPGVLEARMSVCEDYQRPLHFAVTKERAELIPLLVELGADLNSHTGSGRTPLCIAVEKEQEEARAALEVVGASVDLPTAILLKDEGQVSALLTDAVPVAARNLALTFAAKHGPAALVERLLALGAPVDFLAQDDWMRNIAPLGVAANGSNLDAARVLLAAGADPNHLDEYPGATALHYAAWNGQVELAALLLANGARLETKDGMFDADPLGWATENRQEAMIDFLLERGAPADISRVAYFGRLEQVRRMLDEDPAQINFVGNYGTALHQAALHGFVEIVRLLLERGADPQIPNRHGDSVLTMVRKARQGLATPSNLPAHAEIEEMLLRHGARE